MAHYAFVEFIRFASLENSSSDLLTEDDVLELELFLTEHPDAGDLIPGGRGLRKLRRPAKGRGKRGGARVIYYHVTSNHQILLIAACAKIAKSDLDRRQLEILANLVKSEFP